MKKSNIYFMNAVGVIFDDKFIIINSNIEDLFYFKHTKAVKTISVRLILPNIICYFLMLITIGFLYFLKSSLFENILYGTSSLILFTLGIEIKIYKYKLLIISKNYTKKYTLTLQNIFEAEKLSYELNKLLEQKNKIKNILEVEKTVKPTT